MFITYTCLTGCTNRDGHWSLLKTRPPYNPDTATLSRADQAFMAGNYAKAEEIYSILSQVAEDKTTRRKALYGLTCSKLVLAENAAQWKEALILWDTWSQTLQQETKTEDPRMLRPLLRRKIGSADSAKPVAAAPIKTGDIPAGESTVSESDDFEHLKETILHQQKEIDKLKHQISSLEAIDQDMLQKKKEISTQ